MGKLRNDELELDYDAGGGNDRSRSIELSHQFVQNGSWQHYDNSGPTNSKSLSNGLSMFSFKVRSSNSFSNLVDDNQQGGNAGIKWYRQWQCSREHQSSCSTPIPLQNKRIARVCLDCDSEHFSTFQAIMPPNLCPLVILR